MTASSTATSIFTASASERLKSEATSQGVIVAPLPTTHANRVGVAAYLSIMNPTPAISMQTEA